MPVSSRERILAALSLEETDTVPISPLLHVQFPSTFLGIDLRDLASPFATYPVWKAELETFERLKMDAMVDGAPDAIQARWPLPFLHTAASYMRLPAGVRIRINILKKEGGRIWIRRDFETPKGVLETECIVPDGDQAWEKKPLINNPVEDFEKVRCVLDGTISLEGYEKVRDSVGDRGVVKVMTQLPINFWMGYRDTAGTRSVVEIYRQPDIVRQYLRLFMEKWLLPLVEACSEHQIDVMWLDGTYTGYLNNKMFQEYVLPDLKSVTKRAEFPIILFLSGGPCNRFMEEVKDSGVECVEGLDPPPTGDIALSDVKKKIGDYVCLKGNLDTSFLEMESPSRVEEKVKECISAAAYSGGYILSAVDQPTPRTPVENMISLVNAGRKYGKYRRHNAT
jgi:hypothetical protein